MTIVVVTARFEFDHLRTDNLKDSGVLEQYSERGMIVDHIAL